MRSTGARPGGPTAGVAVAAAVVAALVLAGEQQALVIGVVAGAGYGLLALGLVLVYKASGVFNVAQGEFATVAVYVLYLLHGRLPWAVAAVAAVAAAGLLGVATEALVVRPLFRAPRVTLLVATAGVALLAVGVQAWFGEFTGRNVAPGLARLDRVRVLGVAVSDQRLLLLAALVALAGALAWFFGRADTGLALLGASQDPVAAELSGIPVRRLSSLVWGMAGVLGGLAGVLAGPVAQTFGPGSFTQRDLVPAFTAAVVGGMTSLPGAFLGGIVVGVATSAAASVSFLEQVKGQQALASFVVLVAVLSVRPRGLLGREP